MAPRLYYYMGSLVFSPRLGRRRIPGPHGLPHETVGVTGAGRPVEQDSCSDDQWTDKEPDQPSEDQSQARSSRRRSSGAHKTAARNRRKAQLLLHQWTDHKQHRLEPDGQRTPPRGHSVCRNVDARPTSSIHLYPEHFTSEIRTDTSSRTTTTILCGKNSARPSPIVDTQSSFHHYEIRFIPIANHKHDTRVDRTRKAQQETANRTSSVRQVVMERATEVFNGQQASPLNHISISSECAAFKRCIHPRSITGPWIQAHIRARSLRSPCLPLSQEPTDEKTQKLNS